MTAHCRSLPRAPQSPALSASFEVDGKIGLGVPIGTDAFIQHFVKDKFVKDKAIIQDVDKLDHIQDGFIYYQLIRFCQATRLQYLNGHVQLANQNVLQQHVDCHIASALLKKGTQDTYKTWNQQDRAWVDMRLHESHDEGGFGIPNNTITRRAAAYTTNARFVAFLGTFACSAQQVWLPANDLQDPATWMPPPLCQLKQMHEDLLQHYNCTDQAAAAQPAPPSVQATALLQMQAQTRSLSPQAPKTTATANSSFRSSTASTRHSSGVRFPPRRLPARTSPLGPGPFRRNAVSPSSSPRNGPSARPSASAMRALVLRSSASSTCLRTFCF